ncbi:Anti-sigma factor ChrR [Pseudooceanicola batsensis HTCC2597]|uniref:Anti-sigma factor ChrR n=1 Tax=Pseudooceanicola batsensis (strain ATCC BAA-863 / DSM 15984 / KCTC 12145 / HTCC2597) TaxID=252305 RepID=A3TYG3_PSEBH|nr:ChrR family anti-sigma-E factor [Pseudooceanicola batsensis]EAQ03197.1 Anti-sigma factor ChrR [Pseudooceanicola batsensis HTCC2597]
MSIKHHLTESLLMGYAAGTLPEAFNLVVASHVSMCDSCRAAVESYETLGGALLDDTSSEMAPDGLASCLARLDGGGDEVIVPPRPAAPGTLPAPLRDYVGGDLEAIRWRPVGGGVKQAILPTSASASARLLFIPAGAAVPDHGHRGMELTMVLQGAFADETDRFGRGDVEVADEELEHMPVAEPGEDCICLAATDAPLRFRSWLPRLAQPFLKI